MKPRKKVDEISQKHDFLQQRNTKKKIPKKKEGERKKKATHQNQTLCADRVRLDKTNLQWPPFVCFF